MSNRNRLARMRDEAELTRKEQTRKRAAAGKPARGVLRVAARAEGDRILIEIEEDGR